MKLLWKLLRKLLWNTSNKFFEQDAYDLSEARIKLIQTLENLQRSRHDIKDYLVAFDYFCEHPDKYDGATIVKDLVDIRQGEYYLDVDAMIHDYEYIMGANKSFTKKWTSDRRYIRNMELNGKGVRITRFLILTISGIVWVPKSILFN